jgi:hypothetical protein
MGVMRGYTLRDKRGRAFEANVADCVNIDRTPKVREQILEGEFHRVPNPSGDGRVSVEKTFFYADFSRGQFFLVLPRWDRLRWQAASHDLRAMMAHFPEFLVPSMKRKVRVVCGLAELREKLLVFDAEFDDRLVEMLKSLIQFEHPFLLQHPRLNIELDRVTADSVEFVATYDHRPERYRIGYPRRLIDDLFAYRGYLEESLQEMGKALDVPDEPDPLWINHRRTAPHTWALVQLDRYAREIERNPRVVIDIDSNQFEKMLQLLPRGSELSPGAKKDLLILRGWSGTQERKKNPGEFLKEELWEIYFGKELKGGQAILKPDAVERLWKVLDGLNGGDFEGNSYIDQIHLGLTGNGSFYKPSTDDIGIDRSALAKGQSYDPSWFEQVVLHEVGHGVHARHQIEVDKMLEQDFGWARYGTSQDGIDKWIKKMGGYPGGTTGQQQQQIRSYIRQSVGNGKKWRAPARPQVPRDHPWHTEDFGPRLACERTVQGRGASRWYDCSAGWYRQGSLRFFVNYYYGELMIVNEDALAYVKSRALDTYALMAPPEFFAELYMTVHATHRKLAERVRKLDRDLVQYVRSLGEEREDRGGQEANGDRRRRMGPITREKRKPPKARHRG